MPEAQDRTDALLRCGLAALAGAALGAALAGRSRAQGREPNRHTALAQLEGTPPRRYYLGRDLRRAVAIEDLRAMTHRFLPKFALEYLEGGAEDEATMWRERRAYADWRVAPRTLVDAFTAPRRTPGIPPPRASPAW